MKIALDAGFTGHSKVMALGSRSRRWIWLEILVYTCDRNDPTVPRNIGTKVAGASKAFLNDCIALSLIDVASDKTLFVHDWRLYNGTIDERVGAYLESYPEATANEVQSHIQGRRDVVLAAVKRFRGTAEGVTKSGTTVPGLPVPKVVPLAFALSTSVLQPSTSPTEVVSVPLSSEIREIYDHWRTERGKTRAGYDVISEARSKKIAARLREFTADELKTAISNVANEGWDGRAHHDDLTKLLRDRESVDRLLDMTAPRSNGHKAGLSAAEIMAQAHDHAREGR